VSQQLGRGLSGADPRLDDLGVGQSRRSQRRRPVGHDVGGIVAGLCLLRIQGQQLIGSHEPVDGHRRVDHGLGDGGVAPGGLGGGAKRRPHRRDGLLVGGLARASHRRGRAERRSGREIDLVGGNGQQRPGRQGLALDVAHGAQRGVGERRLCLQRRVQQPAGRVDREHHGGGVGVGGLGQGALDIGRQALVDGAGDLDDMHRPARGLGLRTRQRPSGAHGHKRH
jgi:hypothetical protein